MFGEGVLLIGSFVPCSTTFCSAKKLSPSSSKFDDLFFGDCLCSFFDFIDFCFGMIENGMLEI